MTVTALAPRTGSTPAAEVVAGVHALLDGLAGVDGAVDARLLVSVDRAICRLQGLRLSLVAAADRADVADGTGLPGTSAWLAARTRVHGAAAARDVTLATALDDGLPVTRAALADGALSPEHAAVIARTSEQLPTDLTPTQKSAVEAHLVDTARRIDPHRLRRVARTALAAAGRDAAAVAAHRDQVLRDQETAARDAARLTLHDNGDGTTTGHFTVPTLAAAMLRKVVQAMTAPRRQQHTPTTWRGAAGRRTDWAHEHGIAFTDLLTRIPTDHLHHKSAATIVVTLDHATLVDDLIARGVATIDTGHDLSAAHARRLACSAGILPVVLGGASQALDLGRTERFFTQAQRTALATRYDTCAANDCDRPYAWTELHHQHPWSTGGATNLANAVPLCSWHHHRAHDPTLRTTTTGPTGAKTVSYHPRT